MDPITEPVDQVDPSPIGDTDAGRILPTEVSTPVDSEPENYSAEYVHKLREENAAARVKSKRVDDANARLVAAYAGADGRLVDASALPYSEDLLDADGLVDGERVAAAIAALLEAKPYLTARRPAPLPMGVQQDVPTDGPGLFSLIRARA